MNMTNIFSNVYRQKVRKQCNETIYHWICNQTSFPPHVLEFVIKSFHFQHIFLSFSSIIVLPFEIFVQIFWISICLFCLFIYLDGCILSNIEYKLCTHKDQFINIIDPFLYLVDKPTTSYNRFYYTLYLAVLYFIGCFLKWGVYLEKSQS